MLDSFACLGLPLREAKIVDASRKVTRRYAKTATKCSSSCSSSRSCSNKAGKLLQPEEGCQLDDARASILNNTRSTRAQQALQELVVVVTALQRVRHPTPVGPVGPDLRAGRFNGEAVSSGRAMVTVRSEIGPYRRLITALPRQKQCVRPNETQSALHKSQNRRYL